jgi:formylglycine-generating enzyme required for sulfatase activity
MSNYEDRGHKTNRMNDMDTDKTMPVEALENPFRRNKYILIASVIIGILGFLLTLIMFIINGGEGQINNARIIGQEGNTRTLGCPETVVVESGTAVIGTDLYADDNNSPVKKIAMKAFRICRYEISNLQYSEFIRKTGHKPPSAEFWPAGRFRSGEEDFPVVGLSRDDAADYCYSCGMRLPTEEEWEYAARTGEGNYFPWGNEADFSGSNIGSGFPVRIGTSKRDVNIYGINDLAGNVREWTSSESQRESSQGYNVLHFVIRGGSWEKIGGTENARLTKRGFVRAEGIHSGSSTIGFRCVADAE